MEPGKIDRTAVIANLTFMAHLLTKEELLELRKIITKELSKRHKANNDVVLSKIRAEIANYQKDAIYSDDVLMSKRMVLAIIDKYKAESEEDK